MRNEVFDNRVLCVGRVKAGHPFLRDACAELSDAFGVGCVACFEDVCKHVGACKVNDKTLIVGFACNCQVESLICVACFDAAACGGEVFDFRKVEFVNKHPSVCKRAVCGVCGLSLVRTPVGVFDSLVAGSAFRAEP